MVVQGPSKSSPMAWQIKSCSLATCSSAPSYYCADPRLWCFKNSLLSLPHCLRSLTQSSWMPFASAGRTVALSSSGRRVYRRALAPVGGEAEAPTDEALQVETSHRVRWLSHNPLHPEPRTANADCVILDLGFLATHIFSRIPEGPHTCSRPAPIGAPPHCWPSPHSKPTAKVWASHLYTVLCVSCAWRRFSSGIGHDNRLDTYCRRHSCFRCRDIHLADVSAIWSWLSVAWIAQCERSMAQRADQGPH